jgi:hypothetical protein
MASAQDFEDRMTEFEESDETLQIEARFGSEWFEFNNLDFRELDESSDQAILDSDDRGSFAYTGIGLDLSYEVDDRTELVLATSYRGLWGNDQIGGTNMYGSWIYFTDLYLKLALAAGDDKPSMTLGRQSFRLGGLGGARDYIIHDTIDMIRLDMPLGALNFVLIPVNVVGMSQDNDGLNFLAMAATSNIQLYNFRGDRLTRRHGAVVEFDPGPVETRLYGFYSDLGALGSGSDITYNGLIGNFADNDWIGNYGVRGAVDLGKVTPFVHLDGSTGIDRKELVAIDVDTTGLAWGAGVKVDTADNDDDPRQSVPRLEVEAQYFDATGPGYAEFGLQFSHGYVGMKGKHAGIIFSRALGFHPTAYLGTFGVSDTPHEQDRKSAARVIHAGAEARVTKTLHVGGDWWMLHSKGVTFVDFSKLNTLNTPFGYARAEFAAQKRIGEALGQEVNLRAGVTARDKLMFWLIYGRVFGGSYYDIEVDRVAGTALGEKGGPTPWAWSSSVGLKF